MTLVPYEPKLIDFTAMNPDQIVWFNDFNAKVLNIVGTHFADIGRDDVHDWVASKTQYVNPGLSKWVQEWKDNGV